MTEVNQIYKCQICGNVVNVLENGAGKLVCCGQDMHLQETSQEKEQEEKSE